MTQETNGPGTQPYTSPRFIFNEALNLFTDPDGNPVERRNLYDVENPWRDAHGLPVPALDAVHYKRADYDALPDDQARFNYTALPAHHTHVTDPNVQAMLHFYFKLADPAFPITPALRTALTREASCDPYSVTDEALTHRPLILWRELPPELFKSAEDATLYNGATEGIANRPAELSASSSTLMGTTPTYRLTRATEITLHPNPPEQARRPDYPRHARRLPVPGLPLKDGKPWAYNFTAEHVRWVLSTTHPDELPTYTPRLPQTHTQTQTPTQKPIPRDTALTDTVAARYGYDDDAGAIYDKRCDPPVILNPHVTRQIAIPYVENGQRMRRILTPQQIALCLMTGQEPQKGVRIYFNDGDNTNLRRENLSVGTRPTQDQTSSKTPAKQRANAAFYRAVQQRQAQLMRPLTDDERADLRANIDQRYGI